MHAIIESLPVIAGALIAVFLQAMKPASLKNILMVSVPLIAGMIVNRISGERFEWVIADILLTFICAVCFTGLFKLLAHAGKNIQKIFV
jgi:hypothetical protein